MLFHILPRSGNRSLTDGGEAELGDEFPTEVLNDHLLRANLQGLLLDGGPVLLLADVAEEADDIVALLCQLLGERISSEERSNTDQPAQNAAGVKTA